MLLTKKYKGLIILLSFLISPFIIYKLQGTKIHQIKFDDENEEIEGVTYSIFVIQNPPSSKKELIKLIQKMNDTIKFKSKVNKKNYIQAFYKETFNLTRFYKPHYNTIISGDIKDIRSNDEVFWNEAIVDYVVNNEQLIIDYQNCVENCPTLPYYHFKNYNKSSVETINDKIYDIRKGSSIYYYPKGFREDSNQHWSIIINTEEVSKTEAMP